MEWLPTQGFDKSYSYGGIKVDTVNGVGAFLIDMTHKKWCKNGSRKIYDFDVLRGAKVLSYVKTESVKQNGKTVNKKINTYEVAVRTSDIANSVVSIPCGTMQRDAERICAIVENIVSGDAIKLIKGAVREEPSNVASGDTVKDELIKYKAMMEQGLITADDFEKKKNKLLDI